MSGKSVAGFFDAQASGKLKSSRIALIFDHGTTSLYTGHTSNGRKLSKPLTGTGMRRAYILFLCCFLSMFCRGGAFAADVTIGNFAITYGKVGSNAILDFVPRQMLHEKWQSDEAIGHLRDFLDHFR